MVKVSLRYISVEADDVCNAAPRFEADERATRLMRRPNAVGFSLVTADREIGSLLLIQQGHTLHGTVLQHECIDSEGIASDGQQTVFIHRHRHGSIKLGEVPAIKAMAEHQLLHQLTGSIEALQVAVNRIL